MSSESDGEYSEIEEEPRLKYKRIGNNILGLVGLANLLSD